MRDLFKDLLKYLPGVLVPAAVGLVEIPVLTRLFRPEQYGQYMLVISTVLAMVVGVGWVNVALIRFHPACERKGQVAELHATVVKATSVWLALLAGGFFGVVVLLRNRLGPGRSRLFLLGALLLALLGTFHVLQHFLRARRRSGWYSAFAVWQSAGRLGIGILLVLCLGLGVDGLLWGHVIAIAVVCPLLFRIGVTDFSRRTPVSIPLVKEMVRYGFPLALCNLLEWVVSLSSLFFLEIFRTSRDVGVFSANQVLSAKAMFLLVALFQVASKPLEMKTWETEGPRRSRQFVSDLTRYFLLACLPLAGLLAVLAEPIITLFVDPRYHEGYRIIPFIVTGSVLLGLHQRYQAGLMFHKKTALITLCFLFSGLVSLGLNLLLVPRYGYMGAAVTALISYAALLAATVVLSRRYFPWRFPFATACRSVAALAGMGCVVHLVNRYLPIWLPAKLLAAAVTGVVVYGVMLGLLREFRPNERRFLHGLVTGRFVRRRSTAPEDVEGDPR